MSLLAEKRKTAEAARLARIGDLADLPVVEVPARGPEKDAFALDLTGSGGYVGFDAEIGRALTGRGVPLVVLSSLDYFWKSREPDGTGRDLARILERYLAKWHKKKAILVGYSQGADILPFMVKRLPAALRARVGVLGLIGPDASAQFDMGLSSFRKKPAPPELPVVPEIAALQKVKTVCVYGKREKTTICPRLDPRQVDLFQVPGGHAFEGNGEALVDHFLAAAGLTVRPLPAAPARAGRATPSRRARG
jgi:type IV secretory pathway VirJ component